jgi:hypothetical protein
LIYECSYRVTIKIASPSEEDARRYMRDSLGYLSCLDPIEEESHYPTRSVYQAAVDELSIKALPNEREPDPSRFKEVQP